ncbi:MAG TPA: toll/interleukin-1 receptor domain-containing protein [Pyrinomonadaceae bacterium]|jgi:hypothetical protein|nr:toll/interleukin-1 receptor domain-containing protein [Pyrinomonadaceae bacterium]
MNVFFSYSGERSKRIAEVLRDWLPTVIQAAKPWMSEADINKGARWLADLTNKLEQTQVGIICLTPDNLTKPWILFEAGALSKTQPNTYVCTFLIDLEPSDLEGPLAQFQTTLNDKQDIRRLLETLNMALREDALDKVTFQKVFERAWPDLEKHLGEIPNISSPPRTERTTREMMREVLEIIRAEEREAEARESDFYKSRDAFMLLMIKLFQASIAPDAQVPPEIAKEAGDFFRYGAAYFSAKRDISHCPECEGTGWMYIPGRGALRCQHKGLNEPEAEKERSNENSNS